MLTHLLRRAWRNVRRNPIYSVVTVAGMSLGICACICIYVIVDYEYSFDAGHPDGNRIYRVIGELTLPTAEKERYMVLPPAALRDGRGKLSGVESMAGVVPFAGWSVGGASGGSVKADGKRLAADGVVIAEGSWFDIFSYRWLAGDRHRALEQPFKVVLTLGKAQQYFGMRPPQEYIGRQVIYDDSLSVTVSGIVKDWDRPTDLPYSDFLSYPTISGSFLAANYALDGWNRPDFSVRIWVKLTKDARPAAVDAQLAQLVRAHGDPGVRLALTLQPLASMHFDADIIESPIRTAHRPTLYGLIVLALAILVLAIVNFVNLSTAHSLQRTKEVGVRKVLGSSRSRLVVKFVAESFLLILLAAGVAVALVQPVLGGFRAFLPPGVHFQLLRWGTAGFLAALLVVTTLLAGLYPARVASAYLPVVTLRGGGGERWWLRRGLIVLQFTISLVFIICSLLIARQLRYVQHKDLGFRSDAVVEFGIPNGDSLAKVKTLEEMLRKVVGVRDVTRQWLAPMTENGRGMRLKFSRKDVTELGVTQVDGDEHFIPLYGIRLVAGRNLFAADSVVEMVINETLARRMGYSQPDEALGNMLYWNDRPYPVVGVAADFHTGSLHDPIRPVCIINRGEREFNLAVKLASAGQDAGAVKATLGRIGRVWHQLFPGGTWTYQFYDQTLALLYEKDRRTETLVNVTVGLAIFISCIGLLGLTLFTVEKRAKEISIRKVLGASVRNMVSLLCRESLGLVGIALLVATPVAWWLMSAWLRGFAYHVGIGVGVFALAGVAVAGMAVMTVSGLVMRAAMANPVRNLKAE